jgi:hypothetical protein
MRFHLLKSLILALSRTRLKTASLVGAVFVLSGCAVFGRATIVVTATPSPPIVTPTVPITPSDAAPTATPTVDAGVIKVWRSPNVPVDFQAALSDLVATGQYAWSDETNAQLKLIEADSNSPNVADWVYVPVVAFPIVSDGIQWTDIQSYWQGNPVNLQASLGLTDAPDFELVTSAETKSWLTRRLGEPASNVKIELVPQDAVVTTLWLRRPAAWGVVPFHQLNSAMKVLQLDGVSVFDRGINLSHYPLVQKYTFTGNDKAVAAIRADIVKSDKWMSTNRDASKLTTMVMTGVTALTRATAYQMELTGITLPARDILPFVQDADFVHTSNEVAFAKNCPDPNPAYTSTNMRFCSKESYLDLLKAARISIIELTGNHVNDWGIDALTNSINLYDANGMKYFGGGRNDTDAKKALTLSHNGTNIAMIGCNPAGPAPAWAKAERPGSARCDIEYLTSEIARLKQADYIVIMTLQYEEFYQYNPTLDQIAYFQKFAEMGADLVMGSQAHVPQGFGFTNSTFIHYGFGNLFFDQMDSTYTRQMFADKLIFYNGKHIGTILFTGLSEDYSRPRPMTAEERSKFLGAEFKASGW